MRNNIILIWMPWSGKSTLAKKLWSAIQYPVIDIDDYMEKLLWISVWEILKWLWEKEFLEFENKVTLDLKPKNTIISCSWSIPLSTEAMDYLRSIWYSILIDTPLDVIKSRLKRMKVDRIIWMADWKMTIDEILDYRKSFYDISYDYAFKNNWIWTKQETFVEFFKYFMKLPFIEKHAIEANLDVMNDIYDNYDLVKKKILLSREKNIERLN